MATDNNIKKYTAADIEKYHKGLLTAKEMHSLEKAALDDPFLADALEGYATTGVNITADISELKKRLEERTEQSKVIPIKKAGGSSSFTFLRVAAMVLVLAGGAYLTYQFAFDKKKDNIANLKKEEIKAPDTSVHPGTSGNLKVEEKTTSNNAKPINGEFLNTDNKDTKRDAVAVEIKEQKQPVEPESKAYNDLVRADIKTSPASGVPVERKEVVNLTVGDDREIKTDSSKEVAPKKFKNDYYAADKDVAGIKNKQDVAGAANNRTVPATRKAAEDQFYRNQAINTFRGRVTDASNIGVPFANVTNVQDNAGTYTDANGYFNFTSPDTILNVQVRSIGFENNLSQLKNNIASNKVVLQDDRKSLNEVVISNQKPNTEIRSRNSNANNTLEEPEPADGWSNYDAYLANNLNIPEDYKTKPTSNPSVELSFEVDKNGEPVNIRVEKSLCNKCDKEAIRLIKEGPKWKRNANKNGRTTVTINF